MNRTDPLTSVAAYAPEATSAPDPDLLAQIWDRIDAGDEPEHRPTGRAGRRLALAGAVAALTIAGAGAAAAATGVTPARAYNWAFGPTAPASPAYQPDLDTARKVFVEDRGDGTEFAGWTVENSKGWLCISTLVEPAGTTTSPFPNTSLDSPGSSCALGRVDPAPFANGDGGVWGTDPDDRVDFVWEAGDAVRAELRVSTGQVYPVSVQDGWLGGIYDEQQIPLGASATIVAFGADGTVLATFQAQGQFGCDQPAGC